MDDELFKRLKATNRLPSPPGVALRILELSRSDNVSLDDMARVISTDPALSGRILKFVNSPSAGLVRRISRLDEAVNHLGLRGVTLMALSFSLVSTGRVEVCRSFRLEQFWSRSLACAVAAKAFASHAAGLDPNVAFVMGLLLHIGQLAMACGIPETYETVLQSAAARPQDLLALERAQLGTTHLEVGARLLRDWNLPEEIWQTLPHLHTGPPGARPADRIPPGRILGIAEVTASLLCDSKAERSRAVEEILRLVEATFQIDEQEWSELYDRLIRDWKTYGRLLSVKTGTDKSFRDLQDEAREQIAALSMATQIENLGMREQNQQLLRRSRSDALTGIANRAAFDERLASELERAKRTGRPLALCLIDVDLFKKFNDSYGHQAGDQVLQAVAKALDDTVRKMDFVARYGGEEFAVIAPECGPSHLAPLAERLRLAVVALRLPFRGQDLRVTTSVGAAFAQWPDQAKGAAELIGRADQLLYEAKRAGRNCCRAEDVLAKVA